MQELLSRAAEDARRIMNGVRPDQFSDPTPCSDFDVKALANHMAGLAAGSERAARKMERMAPPDPMPDLVGDDPGAAYTPLSLAAIEAWRSPGALEGDTHFGPGEMPAQMAGSITLLEFAVHGWDLAAATGQDYRMDSGVAEAVFETVKQLANPDARAAGVFGSEVAIDADASVQERLLAYSGRDPAWSA